VTLTVKADANAALVGDSANLIVEASVEVEGQRPGGQAAAQPAPAAQPARKQRISLGVLPAIAFQVVRP
jgi:hypothetical protein